MKIAIIHNHPSGGAARAVYELGTQLARRHSIDVYTLTTADEALLPSRDYAENVRTFAYARRPPLRLGLYLNELRQRGDLNRLEYVWRDVATAVDIGAYDAAFVSACRYLQAPSVLAFLRTPAAYYCHEPPRRFVEPARRPDAGPLPLYRRLRAAWHRPAARALDRVLAQRDRRNVAAARVVLTNSRFNAARVGAYYERPAEVCHLGVDAERFRPTDVEPAPYVLSVGAIDRHKGHDFLVEALALVPPDARPPLLVAGNYANDAVAGELRAQAMRAGVDLTLRVGIAERDLPEIYARARVFVYAAHNEPFGLAVLEAMAAGVPVVAVSEGGVVDSVVPNMTGLLVPRDASAFADALRSLLVEPERAQSLGRQGRIVAERDWTWDAAARRVDDSLLAAANRTPAMVTA
ncbi:MAG TPA: glycosyltransferase family 4 protein [Dehalococcoidia bacterium]